MALSGDLADYPVPELLQLMHGGRKDGQLLFEHGRNRCGGGVFFERGEVVHAFAPSRLGEPALFHLFAWGEGSFVHLRHGRCGLRSIRTSLPNLLLEGMRRIDEEDPDVMPLRLPSEDTVLYVERDADRLGDVRLTRIEWSMLALVNGRRTLGEVLRLAGGEGRAPLLHGLLAAGVLTEQFDEAFLGRIVMAKVPPEEAPCNRSQPPTIMANLLLRELDGRRDLLAIREALRCGHSDLIEEVRLLHRTGWIRVASGEDDFRRHCW